MKPTLRDPSGHFGSITSLPVDVFVIGAQINILDLQSIIERDTLHFPLMNLKECLGIFSSFRSLMGD